MHGGEVGPWPARHNLFLMPFALGPEMLHAPRLEKQQGGQQGRASPCTG